MKKQIAASTLLALASLFVAPQCFAVPFQSSQDDYALAATYYARGNWDQAQSAFKDLQLRHPRSKEAITAEFFQAEILMQRHLFGRAYQAYQVFLQQHPNSSKAPRATFRMGEAAYRTGKQEVAIRVLEQFIKANPRNELAEFALPYLGEMRLARNEPQLAQRAYETALKYYPSSKISNTARLGLAKSLQRQGNEAEALRFYEFLITQPNDNLYGESHLQMGIIKFAHVDFAAAEDHLHEAVANCESKVLQAEATYWLSRTYIEIKDYEHALRLLRTIVDFELPKQLKVAVLFDASVTAIKTDNDTLALRWLEQLRTKYPETGLADEALGMAIEIHQRRGETDQAMVLSRQFKNSHKNSPLRARILETEGRAHYSAQRYKQTIETFDLLLNEERNSTVVQKSDLANWRYLKSLGHLGLGDFEQAESELSQIDSLVESEQLAPLVQIARATARFGAENYSAAIENYRAYLQLAPEGAEQKRARTELTICLGETREWDKAAAAFDDLALKHENDPIVITTAKFLAERAFSEKQLPHAERWFTLMAEPGNANEIVARGLSGLAWIKMETSDAKSAYEVFERLLNECPDSKFSGEAAMARAKYLEDNQDFGNAALTYGLVIRRFGSSAMASVAKLRRAYALHKLGDSVNLEEAKTLLIEYLNLPSENPLTDEALYELGWIHHDLGQHSECIARFKELVDSEPASKYWPDAAYRVLQNAVAAKDTLQAKSLIQKLISRADTPEQVMTRVLFTQGQIAAQDNQWAEVTKSMSDLIAQSDDMKLKTKANYWLAESLYRQKQHEQALTIFERLIPVVDRLDSNLEPWVKLRTAQCNGYQGDWTQAVAIAKTTLAKFPEFEAGYEFDFIKGRSLEDQGKMSDARLAYHRVVDSAKGGSTETAAIAQWRIGETYFHQEEYASAIKAYHKVDSLFSYKHWRSAALIQAGKCQEHLNNHMHAIKLYTQLVKSFPDSAFANDAQARMNRLTKLTTANQAKRTTPSKQTKSRR